MSYYKPYPTYKDSGVEWLGQVPAHWTVMSIKHIVSIPITDGPHETPLFVDEGIPFVSAEAISSGYIDFLKIRGFITNADHCQYSKKYFPKIGDIFMIKSGATTGITAIVETDKVFNIWSPLAVIRCGERSKSRFVLNFMRSKNFLDAIALNWSFGTQQNIGMGVIENIAITVPSIDEQIVIAAHLDRETARIDGLVSRKIRFIELLREKRQALITHAVTKGLDPNVPMKDSGVEWLGDVPAHWDVTRVKYVIRSMGQGWSPECESRPAEDGEWGVLKVGCVNGGVFRPTENKALPTALVPRPELALKKGDILISRANTRELVGGCAVVEEDYPWLLICDKLYRLNVDNSSVTPAFLAALIAVHGRREVELEATGASASMVNIAQSVIANLQVALPPIEEQIEIIDAVMSATIRYDTLISTSESSIELLKERRSALITAAVTGQIDLRGAA